MVLFVSERLRVDMVAILIMTALIVIGLFRPGFMTVQEGISGFSNKATITIAAMFILSSGLVKTGAITLISQKLIQLGRGSEIRLFLLLMITAGVASAFINNAAAVAVFIPVAPLGVSSAWHQPLSSAPPFILCLNCRRYLHLDWDLHEYPGKLHGSGPRCPGIRDVELTKLGVVFLVVALVYLTFVARKMLPDRGAPDDLTGKYEVGRYFTLLVVEKKSSLVQRTPAESRLSEKYDVTILEIIRAKERIWSGFRDSKLHEGDELLVRGSIHSIMEMKELEGLSIRSQEKYADRDLMTEEVMLAEVMVSPGSSLIGRNLREANFRHHYGVFALAVQKHGETIKERVGNIRLDAGDMLLLQGRREYMRGLTNDRDFLMLQEVEAPTVRRQKAPFALAVIALVVVLAAFKIMPILVAAIVGCILMGVFGCIKLQEAYESIDWFVIFLLAGVIPLGVAMETPGPPRSSRRAS